MMCDDDYSFQDDEWDYEDYDESEDYGWYGDPPEPTLRQRVRWAWQSSRLHKLLHRLRYFRRDDPYDDIPF